MRWGLLVAAVVLALAGPASAATFSNTAAIDVPATVGPATAYPVPLVVGGMTGGVTDLKLRINDLTSESPADLDILVQAPAVGPSNQHALVMSDVGGTSPVEDVDLTLFQGAPGGQIPENSLVTGEYEPRNVGTIDGFPEPAPQELAGYASSLFQVFDPTPNGTWRLWVVDDSPAAVSHIQSWQLVVTTSGTPATTHSSGTAGNPVPRHEGPSLTYPSTIPVSGLAGPVTDVNATLRGLKIFFADEVDVLLQTPDGRHTILMSDLGGDGPSTRDLTFDDSAAGPAPNPIVTGTYKPTNLGAPDADIFDPPAPPFAAPGYPLSMAALNGGPPNGDWKLFVYDDADDAAGQFQGGWSLEISTTGATSFAAATQAFAESVPSVPVTLTRSGGEAPTSVTVVRSGGTLPGGQVSGLPAQIDFAQGEISRTITLGLAAGDSADEPDQTIGLGVSSAAGPTAIGFQSGSTILVTDDDPPPPDVAPQLARASISPRSFRSATTGSSLASPIGGKVSFRTSEPATISVRVQRAWPGRRSGSRCVRPTSRNRRARRCTRHPFLAGEAVRTARAAGAGSFRFRGRIGGRRLVLGSYRLVLVPRDIKTGKSGKPVRIAFRIVRR